MLAALLGLMIAAGATWSVGGHAEIRTPSPGATEPDSPEVELDPRIEVRSAPGEFIVDAAYSPRFVTGGISGAYVTSLHDLHATEVLRAAPRILVELDQRGSFGTSIVSLLGPASATSTSTIPTMPTSPEILPSAGVVKTFGLSGGLSVLANLSSRTGISAGVSYGASGGLGQASRAMIPLQHTPLVRAEYDYTATRLDSFSLLVNGSESLAGPTQQAATLSFSGNYHRRLWQGVTGEVGGGLNYNRTLQPAINSSSPMVVSAVLPVGAAGLNVDLSERDLPLLLTMRATNTSAIDPLTIRVYQRAEGSLSLDVRPQPKFLFTVRALTARAYGSFAGSVAQGELAATWAATRNLQLLAGGRGAWLTKTLVPSGLAGFQWAAYLAINFTQAGAF